MDSTVIVAILSLAGTLAGTFGGILASNKLTTYRIKKLEEKVNEHNNLIRRVYELEKHEAIIDKEIESMSRRLDINEKMD